MGSKQNAPSPNTNAQKNSKQRKKFLEFVQVLEKHDFFKNTVKGSDAYKERMEKAQKQYNSRFPNMKIDSLAWMFAAKSISDEDRRSAEALKKAGNALLGQKKYANA